MCHISKFLATNAHQDRKNKKKKKNFLSLFFYYYYLSGGQEEYPPGLSSNQEIDFFFFVGKNHEIDLNSQTEDHRILCYKGTKELSQRNTFKKDVFHSPY